MKKFLLFILLALPAFAGREFITASSQFAAKTSAPTTYPVTISAWFNSYSTNANQVIAGLFQSDARRLLVYYSPSRTVIVDAIDNGGATPALATSTTTAATNTWNHILAIWDSATSRRVYLNGAGSATNSTSKTTSGLTTLAVGARNNSGTWGLHFNGVLAEVAVWNVALTAAELVSLNSGASALEVRPESRVHYSPLIGQEANSEWDYQGSQLGLTNTPAPSALHPRIYRP